jgi:protoheme IX farnesyltransferase
MNIVMSHTPSNPTLQAKAGERKFRIFLMIAGLSLFIALMLGYLLRFNPPGAGCPDWPTCYGQFDLPEAAAARLDVAHRAISGLAAVLIAAATVWALLRRETRRWIRLSLAGASLLMAAQILVGRGVVLFGQSAWLGAVHQGLALLAMALVSLATVKSYFPEPVPTELKPGLADRRFRRMSLAALAAIFTLMLTGALSAALDAGQACAGWPLCTGGLPQSSSGWLALAHRLTALTGAILIGAVFLEAWRGRYRAPLTLSAATAAAVLLAGQVFIGALKVVREFPLDLVVLHAASAAGLWTALVILAASASFERLPAAETGGQDSLRLRGRARLRIFLALNKPVIVLLLLVTTYAGMVVGGRQIPSFWLTLWTMIGGALAAGGSSALNQYIDREIDGRMQRTAKRPLPSGRLQPAEALAYGIAACLTAFFLLAGTVNLLAAVLSLAGMVYYVLIYSILLKKATVQNIVIGGGAGAIPPLVGWAAATGSLNVPSLFLFALVFMWTPPHFWALALVRSKDYARAGVPMLPVVKGEKATRTQIFIYTLELVGLTLLMPVFNVAGSVFLVSAIVLGLWLIYAAWKVLRKPGNKTAYQMYRYSSMYLAFIFLALVLDVLI